MGLDFTVRVDRAAAVCVDLRLLHSFKHGSRGLWTIKKTPLSRGRPCDRVSLTFEELSVKTDSEEHLIPQDICNTVAPCDVCAAVLDAFSAADNDKTSDRDFVNAMAFTSCGRTERLFEEIAHSYNRCGEKHRTLTTRGELCLVKIRRSLMDIVPPILDCVSRREYRESRRTGIVLVRMVYKDRSIGIGRYLSDFIDLEVIRHWRDTCDRQHEGRCSVRLMGLPPIQLPWIIDTYDRCIVSGSSSQRYVALSYVWGASGKAQLTTRTLQKLKKKGSLGINAGSQVPRTIMDAMVLCQGIGERYLWADTLCIPQDDNVVRQHMISNMTAVYANASMTIIAADGEHADHGLRGVPGEFQTPRVPLEVFEGPLGCQVFRKPMKSLDKTIWNTRGWTFQEYAFSPRRLIFIQDTVRWECCQACCWEEIEQPGEALPQLSHSSTASMFRDEKPPKEIFYDGDVSGIRGAQILPLSPYPNLSLLGRLVSAYNRRDLSFDRDAPAAFAGVLTALNNTFLGGFVWGIPAMFFDIVLTWSSTNGVEVANLRPRSSSCPEDIVPPRWSWMSWQGLLSENAWDSSQCIFRESTDPKDALRLWTIPITTWYTQSHKTAERRPIHLQNEWYRYRKLYMGIVDDDSLPPGWKAHRITLSGSSPKKAVPDTATDARLEHPSATTVVYTHDTLGDTVRFWHPVPLNGPSRSTLSRASGVLISRADSHGRYLACQAEQARLYPKSSYGGPLGNETINKTPLTLKNSDEVVCMITPDSTAFSLGYLWGHSPTVTVVAVSGGYVASCPAAPDREMIEHYNVLCVSWEDGVAYRGGVGRISRADWESLERETVDLVLG